jgi:hypothetical protein
VKKSIIAEDEDEFTQVSFFGDDLEDELRENEDGEKFQEIEKPVSTAKQKSVKAPLKTKAPISKKENSGFSLFSFMNSSKVRDEDSDFEEVINETEIEIEESVKKVEIKTQNRPVKKPVDSEKKRREFFSATVLDEDNSFAENGQKVEDDILNVPAFFRRKKS